MRAKAGLLGVVLGILLAVPAAQADLGTTPAQTWVTNGVVDAIAPAGGVTYIGGRFNYVGPRTGFGVGISASTGQSTGLPEITGHPPTADFTEVNAAVADGSGGWFVGGLFSHAGGVARSNLVHIKSNGS